MLYEPPQRSSDDSYSSIIHTMTPENRGQMVKAQTPSPIVEQLGGIIDTPEKTEEFFRIFFTTDWCPRNPNTGRKLERGVSSTYKEVTRLRRESPEILRKVLTEIGADEEEIESWLAPRPWESSTKPNDPEE